MSPYEDKTEALVNLQKLWQSDDKRSMRGAIIGAVFLVLAVGVAVLALIADW